MAHDCVRSRRKAYIFLLFHELMVNSGEIDSTKEDHQVNNNITRKENYGTETIRLCDYQIFNEEKLCKSF